MEFFQILLILLFLVTIATVLSSKLKMSIEIFLLLVSLLISIIPNRPIINIQPHSLLLLFLPPIIFSAAFFTSWRDFIANKRPISLLATGLVIFVMCSVAITLKLLIPDMSWAVCFLSGAIVSPTDASSAVALVKKIAIPKRLITILEGESLINDATALILYRYTLISALTGTWSYWLAGAHFLIAAMGGIVLGLILGFIGIRIYARLSEPKAQSLFTLIIPYVSYLLAESIGISAIICLVTCGIYFSRKFPLVATPESRHNAEAVWELYVFALNALVFILIGLQLPSVINGLARFSVAELVLYIVVVNLIVLISRFLWVYPAAYIPRRLSKTIRQKDPYPHWSELAILSWVGMRGVLSLILAMSIPTVLPSGQPFPYRSLLILLTYSVIITTLVLPTFTLPKLVKLFDFKKDTKSYREEAIARIETIKAILEELKKGIIDYPNLKGYIEQLMKRYQYRLSILQSNLNEAPYSAINPVDQQIRALTKRLLNLERSLLIKMRSKGIIHDEIFHQLERELDLDDLKLKTPRI